MFQHEVRSLNALADILEPGICVCACHYYSAIFFLFMPVTTVSVFCLDPSGYCHRLQGISSAGTQVTTSTKHIMTHSIFFLVIQSSHRLRNLLIPLHTNSHKIAKLRANWKKWQQNSTWKTMWLRVMELQHPFLQTQVRSEECECVMVWRWRSVCTVQLLINLLALCGLFHRNNGWQGKWSVKSSRDLIRIISDNKYLGMLFSRVVFLGSLCCQDCLLSLSRFSTVPARAATRRVSECTEVPPEGHISQPLMFFLCCCWGCCLIVQWLLAISSVTQRVSRKLESTLVFECLFSYPSQRHTVCHMWFSYLLPRPRDCGVMWCDITWV